jgi:hypothetical protein
LHKQAQPGSRPVVDILQADAAEFLKHSLAHTPQLGTWTKLYAASQTLLRAMQEERVLAALVEICSNLLACEQLVIVEIERRTVVRFLAEEGLLREKREALIQNARLLEPRIAPGAAWVPSDSGQGDAALAPLGISALVPLWKDQRSTGAMVLFQLLPQRRGFDGEDRQVLQLLSLYAGPCLRSQVHG